jgi:hypothetical protein
MSAREPFSDALLEQMLVRRAHRGEPGDLRQSVAAGLEAIEPRRPMWRLAWPRLWVGRGPLPLPVVLAVVLLLLALLPAVIAVGAMWLRQHSTPVELTPTTTELTPTGIESITAGDVTWAKVVEDGIGTQWVIGSGQVTRLDPSSGGNQSWSVGDDAALAASSMSPASAGGVWIWSGDRILRFVGDAFAETIPAPGGSGLLDEAPDGTLWAAPVDGGLVRWDGDRWMAPPSDDLPASYVLTALLARSADDVWIAGHDPESPGTPAIVAHLEGQRWSVYDWIGDPMSPVGDPMSPMFLVEGADGSIWVDRYQTEGPIELARLRDGQWTLVDGPAGLQVGDLSAAPDGSMWTVLYGDGAASRIGHYAAGGWTTYGPDEGVTGAAIGTVSATSAGVFAATDQGLLRLDGDGWIPVWASRAHPTVLGGQWGTFVGVSRDETWFADMDGVWHYLAGAWNGPIQPPGLSDSQVTALELGDDGSLWVATTGGVAILTDGRWTTAWDQKVLSMDLAADGSAWVGDFDRIVHLKPGTAGFGSETVSCPVPAITLTIASDGTVWVGGLGYSGKAGLAHFDGARCEEIDLRTDPSVPTVVEVGSIVADPAGGVLIQAFEGMTDSTGVFVDRPTGSIMRLADGRRTVLPTRQVDSSQRAITIGPDGGLWLAIGGASTGTAGAGDAPGPGVARYDGQRWTQVLAGVDAWGPIAVTPDGTLWFQGPAGIERIHVDLPD